MERYGIKRGSALDFRQQDGQQMYNNEKMFDFLYFSEDNEKMFDFLYFSEE